MLEGYVDRSDLMYSGGVICTCRLCLLSKYACPLSARLIVIWWLVQTAVWAYTQLVGAMSVIYSQNSFILPQIWSLLSASIVLVVVVFVVVVVVVVDCAGWKADTERLAAFYGSILSNVLARCNHSSVSTVCCLSVDLRWRRHSAWSVNELVCSVLGPWQSCRRCSL